LESFSVEGLKELLEGSLAKLEKHIPSREKLSLSPPVKQIQREDDDSLDMSEEELELEDVNLTMIQIRCPKGAVETKCFKL